MLRTTSINKRLFPALAAFLLAASLSACASATPSPGQTPLPGASRSSLITTLPNPPLSGVPPTGGVPAGTPIPVTGAPGATVSAAPTATGPSVMVNLTFQNIAASLSTITVPAGATVNLNLMNMDNGIAHNFSVYTDKSTATSIFVGYQIIGPASTIYTFIAPSTPGTYYWQCDYHPAQLNGAFVVQ
jgi:plastocyanin